MDTSGLNTAADPAYGNGGGRAGGFHNIDELPDGKLLQPSFGRKSRVGQGLGRKKLRTSSLREQGMPKFNSTKPVIK